MREDRASIEDRPGRLETCSRMLLGILLLLTLAWAGQAQAQFFRLQTHRFEHDGERRIYLSYTPKNAGDFQGPRPLVLAVHGGGGTARGMIRLTRKRFQRLADQNGFYVVYPQAIDKMWDFGEGKVSGEFTVRRDDLGYFEAVISRMESDFPIDRERIFATGISRGGQASYFLACKLPGRIRAIAPFTMPLPDFLGDDCRDGPPVGVAIFNGTEDPLVPYDGGEVTVGGRDRGSVLSTEQTVLLWRRRNGCDADVSQQRIDEADDATFVDRSLWERCTGAPVALYRIVGGGHTWPSGAQYLPRSIVGGVTRDIDGAREAWDFFSRF